MDNGPNSIRIGLVTPWWGKRGYMISRLRLRNPAGFPACAVLCFSLFICVSSHIAVAATLNGTVTGWNGCGRPQRKTCDSRHRYWNHWRQATADTNGYDNVANPNPATYQITYFGARIF